MENEFLQFISESLQEDLETERKVKFQSELIYEPPSSLFEGITDETPSMHMEINCKSPRPRRQLSLIYPKIQKENEFFDNLISNNLQDPFLKTLLQTPKNDPFVDKSATVMKVAKKFEIKSPLSQGFSSFKSKVNGNDIVSSPFGIDPFGNGNNPFGNNGHNDIGNTSPFGNTSITPLYDNPKGATFGKNNLDDDLDNCTKANVLETNGLKSPLGNDVNNNWMDGDDPDQFDINDGNDLNSLYSGSKLIDVDEIYRDGDKSDLNLDKSNLIDMNESNLIYTDELNVNNSNFITLETPKDSKTSNQINSDRNENAVSEKGDIYIDSDSDSTIPDQNDMDFSWDNRQGGSLVQDDFMGLKGKPKFQTMIFS